MSGGQVPSDLLLQHTGNALLTHVTTHYPDLLHAWLMAKGANAYGALHAQGIEWEDFRRTIAPILCSHEIPSTRQIPMPCRNAGLDCLSWKDVTLGEAMDAGYFWRHEMAAGRCLEKEAVQKLGALVLGARISPDPMIGGMGTGVDKRDLVGKELGWNERLEDESMWNESEGEGGNAGTSGRNRWFLHKWRETREKKRARLAFEQDEDEEMMTDEEQEPVGESDGEQEQAEKTGGLDLESEMRDWEMHDEEFRSIAGF